SPVLRSRQRSDVATLRLTTLPPLGRFRTSGSLPRLPTRMTLFTLPAMALSFQFSPGLPGRGTLLSMGQLRRPARSSDPCAHHRPFRAPHTWHLRFFTGRVTFVLSMFYFIPCPVKPRHLLTPIVSRPAPIQPRA